MEKRISRRRSQLRRAARMRRCSVQPTWEERSYNSSIKQEPQPEDRPPGSFIHGQSNTPDCTARLYRLICSFRFRKSGVDPLNCVRRCSVSTMGSNSNATATFSATSILTGPLSVSGDMISNPASDTHHESASAIGKRTWPGL